MLVPPGGEWACPNALKPMRKRRGLSTEQAWQGTSTSRPILAGMAKKPEPPKPTSWTQERLGTVEAPDEAAAMDCSGTPPLGRRWLGARGYQPYLTQPRTLFMAMLQGPGFGLPDCLWLGTCRCGRRWIRDVGCSCASHPMRSRLLTARSLGKGRGPLKALSSRPAETLPVDLPPF
jgi:hypothetical protein